MKTRVLIIVLISFFIFSCKNTSEEKNEPTETETGQRTSKEGDISNEEFTNEDVKNSEFTDPDMTKDLIQSSKKEPYLNDKQRALINLRDYFDGRITYIEDLVSGHFFFKTRDDRKMAHRKLGFASKEEVDPLLVGIFDITEEELELFKLLPTTDRIVSEKRVKELRNYQLPNPLGDHMASGKASENLKSLIKRFDKDRASIAEDFLKKAARSRKAFYELNPGWYSNSDDTGDTYLDMHRNYIHLPLGMLSFADKVISFETSANSGSYPEGAIGMPDMGMENAPGAHPKFCNLGTRGTLTLEFADNAITDVNGPDLFIFELGAVEPTHLEISKDGQQWVDIGKIDGGTALVDIAPFVNPKETYNYIRLTDLVAYSDLPGADVDAVAAIGGALRLNLDSAVLFDTGKYQLKEGASEELQKLLEDIQEIPSGTIIIEGHTDNVGDPASNKTLSENRAKEVSDFLKKNLSKNYTFQQKGFGESQPIAPNDTDENKQKNRRVEILVMPSK